MDRTGAIPTRADATPASPRVAEMQRLLERYGQAILKLTRREEIIEQAREQIEPLREDVAAIAQELASHGIPVPKRTKRVKPAGGASAGGGPVSGGILAALRGGGRMSAAAIAQASGLDADRVRSNITHLVRRGDVVRVEPGVYEMGGAGDE